MKKRRPACWTGTTWSQHAYVKASNTRASTYFGSSLALSSEVYNPAQLTRMADPDILSVLRGVAGVAEVEIVGEVKPEMTVQLRPQALQAAGEIQHDRRAGQRNFLDVFESAGPDASPALCLAYDQK